MSQEIADLVASCLPGAVVGFGCGLVARAIARRRGRTTLGAAAVISCLLAGVVGGLLIAGPTALLLSSIAWSRPARELPADARPVARASGWGSWQTWAAAALFAAAFPVSRTVGAEFPEVAAGPVNLVQAGICGVAGAVFGAVYQRSARRGAA